jgi:hypothetical protein
MNVPAHLRHLRRDHGLPVPYVNVWGSHEAPERWSIRFDRTARDVCAFLADDRSEGPDFTRQSPQRQREVMIRRLCQVCARRLEVDELHLVLSPVSMQTAAVPELGGRVPLVSEPWLCAECANFAVRVCPALIRRRRDEELTVLPMAGVAHSLVLSRGWIDGPHAAATKAHPVGMFVKIAIPALTLAAGR